MKAKIRSLPKVIYAEGHVLVAGHHSDVFQSATRAIVFLPMLTIADAMIPALTITPATTLLPVQLP